MQVMICIVILGSVICFLLWELIKANDTIVRLMEEQLKLKKDYIEAYEGYEETCDWYMDRLSDLSERLREYQEKYTPANTDKVEISSVEYDLAQMGREK